MLRQKFKYSALGIVVLLACALGGCSGLIRPYDYAQPGDARHQRSIAISHDPYPLDDVGPDVLGGRPQGVQKPMPEVNRARFYNPPTTPLKPIFSPQPMVVSPVITTPPPNPWPAPPPVQTVPAPYPPASPYPNNPFP
jgi:hypothetical protein